jgi:F-type H+-transporting ATPase subunit b
MGEIFVKLGIDWKLLGSQALNFAILLGVLFWFVYKPLLKLLSERRQKIEQGLLGAEEAKRRLAEIEIEREAELAKARESALGIIGRAEGEASVRADVLLSDARKKSDALLKAAAKTAAGKTEEELEALSKQAADLIKDAIIATVELDPSAIDNALIAKAAAGMKARLS